jgi:hypothetical protein
MLGRDRRGGTQRVVVASSITSAVDVARESYPWLPVRWLRTRAHRLFVDPFHDGVVEGVEA